MSTENNGCKVDGNGYVVTPSGAKAARVADGRLWLYDKRTHQEVPFTLSDLTVLVTQTQTQVSHEPRPFDNSRNGDCA